MDGYQFEEQCAIILKRKHFSKIEVTKSSGDQGVDIIAYKHRKKYGIQCKYYTYPVGNKAVQEAYAGANFYDGKLNRKCVGRDAKTLLGMIGVTVPDNIRCITFEGPKEHPLIATELMMPILGVVRAKDFDDAVEQAVWLEHGNRHSAHIHSKNVDRITKYAKAIDTAILVKNGPSYAALGFGGEGFCTFTIASRTGEGLTSASSFTKRRRCVMTDSLCIR